MAMTFWDELRNGDAMPMDSYGWATNQGTHALSPGIGGALLLMMLGLHGWAVVAVVVLVYFIGWEWAVQMRSKTDIKLLGDSLTDTAFTAAGAWLILTADPPYPAAVFLVWALIHTALAVGIWRRQP